MSKTTRKQDNSAQHKAFIEAARDAGCDEDPKAFDAKMRKMLGAKKRNPKTRATGEKGR